MECVSDSREERQPHEPLPFRLSRAGKHPDIEDTIEGVLTVAGHEQYREALVKIVVGMLPLLSDKSASPEVQECLRTLAEIRDHVISRVGDWDYSKIGPDELVAWSDASRRRLWYLEHLPFMPDKYMPLVPKATLGDNRLIIIMGLLLGSSQPYEDWAKLWAEIELGNGCSAEIHRRVAKRTGAGLYMSLVYGSVEARGIAYNKLLKKAIWGASSIILHPDKQQDWEDKIGDADWVITRDAKKAKGMFSNESRRILRDILRGDFESIGMKLKSALIDNLRMATAKKRIPQDHLDSLEGILEETGTDPGRMDEVLQKKEVKARIDQHKQEIIDACGPRAPEVMKTIIDDPSLTNEALADRIKVSERHIYNIKSCFKENSELLKRVFFGH